MSSKSKELEQLRGMSEPMPFLFNTLDHGRRLLVHAVIFTSYEVADNERVMELARPELDIRMAEFIKYCVNNYAKEAKQKLEKLVDEHERSTKKARRDLAELDRKIEQLNKEEKDGKQE